MQTPQQFISSRLLLAFVVRFQGSRKYGRSKRKEQSSGTRKIGSRSPEGKKGGNKRERRSEGEIFHGVSGRRARG